MKRNYSDISKASEMLNWKPNKDLIAGLEETVEYFIKRNKL